MAYPQTSNFSVRGADAFNPPAWWTYTRDDGRVDVCGASGAWILSQARQASRDPRVVNIAAPSVRWDRELGDALARQADLVDTQQPGQGWGDVAARLRSDASGSTMSPLAMRFALWLVLYRPNQLRFDAIGIPSGAVLPRAGVTIAAGPADVGVVCIDPRVDPVPGVVANSQALEEARAQSVLGVRVHPGEASPRYDLSVPAPSGSVPLWVLGGVMAVGLVLVVSLAQSGREASRQR